jgi:hypothetical protein
MSLKDKEATYLDLVERTEQQTDKIKTVDRLTGDFAFAILKAIQADLSHDEMVAALTIGHYFGSKNESSSPNHSFLFAQPDYWEAVYLEAEAHWARRYRSNE